MFRSVWAQVYFPSNCWFQMQELALYIMILLVFLLAYGISTNALMYRSRSLQGLVFRDIVYYPYWQIYGELYLEELEGTSGDV